MKAAIPGKFPTNPQLTQRKGKIGIEYNPAGAWTRYRVDIEWDTAAGMYVLTDVGRITPVSHPPLTDRTIFFSIGQEVRKINFYSDGNMVNHITMKVGETLLLKRDMLLDHERNIEGYSSPSDSSAVDIKMIEGDFLVTAKNPGEVDVVLWPRHYASDEKLNITVEP